MRKLFADGKKQTSLPVSRLACYCLSVTEDFSAPVQPDVPVCVTFYQTLHPLLQFSSLLFISHLLLLLPLLCMLTWAISWITVLLCRVANKCHVIYEPPQSGLVLYSSFTLSCHSLRISAEEFKSELTLGQHLSGHWKRIKYHLNIQIMCFYCVSLEALFQIWSCFDSAENFTHKSKLLNPCVFRFSLLRHAQTTFGPKTKAGPATEARTVSRNPQKRGPLAPISWNTEEA